MKIAIYDTQHYEMVNVLFNIFDTDNNELLFLVDEKLQQKMFASPFTASRAKIHHYILESSGNKPEFYANCKRELNKFKPDLFYLNTIDKDYKEIWEIIQSVDTKIGITLHNINTWLNPPFTLNKIALKNYWFRRKIVKKTTFIAVQEELFIQYIRTNKLYKKPVTAIPHTLLEEEPVHPVNRKLRVAIPGGIDGVRRDYDFALDVMEELNKVSDNIQYVFLGEVIGYLGEKIWKRVNELQSKGIDILHYFDPHSNKTFDEQFRQCDLVFLPLNVDTKYEGIPEVYGTSKVTGVIYDMMRFAKPGFVPAKMVIPPTMNESLYHYRSKENLVALFKEWLDNPELVTNGKIRAGKNATYYTSANIRNRFWSFYRKEVDSGNK